VSEQVCSRGLQPAFGFAELLQSGAFERGLKPATTYSTAALCAKPS
jgi:hypothetical protein